MGRPAVKTVLSRDNILNDNGTHVDHLNHVVYAEALTQHLQLLKTPVTIGIFSEWGSGKTFLLKHVQCLLNLQQRHQQKERNKNNQSKYSCDRSNIHPITFGCILIVFIGLVLAILICQRAGHSNNLIFILCVILLFYCCVVIYSIKLWVGKASTKKGYFSYGWTIIYALFTKLPISNDDTEATVRVTIPTKFKLQLDNKTDDENDDDDNSKDLQKFIFVNFNAWEYAGCDVLWAGIVTHLADKIEEEFGTLTRLFRTITLETVPRFHQQRESDIDTAFLIQISESKPGDDLEREMKMFGIVVDCIKLSKWKYLKKLQDQPKNKDGYVWWVVTYQQANEAKCAFKTLDQCPVAVEWPVFKTTQNRDSNFCILKRFWNYFKQNPKTTCDLPNLAWYIIFVIAAVTIPLALTPVIIVTGSLKSTEPTAIFLEIISKVPIISEVGYVIIWAVWSLFHSQKGRIIKALEAKNKNIAEELGFMHKIKNEVKSITDFVHTVEFIYKVAIKIVITIDDLDRVPLPKVKDVLESINILLSERNSPFVCLIAVDSRIAIKCFEGNRDDDSAPSISGYEYLKKIVNLPFCLPKVNDSNRSKYIAGLIDETNAPQRNRDTEKYAETSNVKSLQNRNSKINQEEIEEDSFNLPKKPIDFKSFIFTCRNYMLQNKTVKKHLQGNPRNIKRIFNVISVTSSVIRCHQERQETEETLNNIHQLLNTSLTENKEDTKIEKQHRRLAENVVLWAILTVQWPLSISYIIKVMGEADQRAAIGMTDGTIDNKTSLFDIYIDIQHEIDDWKLNSQHRTLDADSGVLYSFLKYLQNNKQLNKRVVKNLLNYSVNLDHGLCMDISNHRNTTNLTRFDKTLN